MIELLGFVALGLGTGILAATLGIGGGIIFVPSLVVFFSFEQHVAQGTSLAVILIASPSTIAVFPTPASPISTGLFLVRRLST